MVVKEISSKQKAKNFAIEGADIAIVYLNEDVDAKETQPMVEAEGRKYLLLKGGMKKIDF